MPSDSCACCGAPDFKKCECPWDKPFEDWPKRLIQKVAANFTHGALPHPNS